MNSSSNLPLAMDSSGAATAREGADSSRQAPRLFSIGTGGGRTYTGSTPVGVTPADLVFPLEKARKAVRHSHA